CPKCVKRDRVESPTVLVFICVPGGFVFCVTLVLRIPSRSAVAAVKKNHVVDRAVAFRAVVRSGPLPNDLVLKMRMAEDAIHHDLDVVTGGWIAVQVDRAGRLE